MYSTFSYFNRLIDLAERGGRNVDRKTDNEIPSIKCQIGCESVKESSGDVSIQKNQFFYFPNLRSVTVLLKKAEKGNIYYYY